MTMIKFMRLSHGLDLELPSYATPQASGMDIRSAESFKLYHGQTKIFTTGIAAEVLPGYEVQIRSRSGLAAKHGIFVTNGIGTIDADYRGELMVILSHLGRNAYEIQRGERIAQLVVMPVRQVFIEEVTELSVTDRGVNGLGSTGRQ